MDIDLVIKLLEGYDIPIRNIRNCSIFNDNEIEITEIVSIRVCNLSVKMIVTLEVDNVLQLFPERQFIHDVICDLYTARGFIPGKFNFMLLGK